MTVSGALLGLASAGSVRRAKVLEHREVLEVACGEVGADLFGRGCDCEIGDPDARMTAAPLAPEFPGAARHGFAHGNPDDQRKEPVGRSPLRGSQPLDHLYPTDL